MEIILTQFSFLTRCRAYFHSIEIATVLVRVSGNHDVRIRFSNSTAQHFGTMSLAPHFLRSLNKNSTPSICKDWNVLSSNISRNLFVLRKAYCSRKNANPELRVVEISESQVLTTSFEKVVSISTFASTCLTIFKRFSSFSP